MLVNRRIWIGFSLGALLLVLFLATVDIGRMADALAKANYLYIIPGIGLYMASVFFRTLRWKILIQHMKVIPVLRLYPVVVVGYMANNLLPMRLGELVRSYYLSEREGISKTSTLTTIFVERLLDAIILIFSITIIAVFVPLSGLVAVFSQKTGIGPGLLIVGFSAPFFLMFGSLMLFALFPNWVRTLAWNLSKSLPGRIKPRLQHLIDMSLIGLMPLTDPKTLTQLIALTFPIWLFEAGLFFFVGVAFGLQDVYVSFVDMWIAMILVTGISNIGSSIPAGPGGIGLFELITRETLVFMPTGSVDKAMAAAFAAVVHVSLLLPMIVLGQLFLWTENISLSKLSQAVGIGYKADK